MIQGEIARTAQNSNEKTARAQNVRLLPLFPTPGLLLGQITTPSTEPKCLPSPLLRQRGRLALVPGQRLREFFRSQSL
jgi:hypothetical protein